MTAPARCPWPGTDPLYIEYHDREWGTPLHDDRRLFEMLVLEGAQAGLSWITILRKRDRYREVFDGFDPRRVARFTPARVARLLADPGIVRNRQKIEAAVNNAKRAIEAAAEFGSLDACLWRFVNGRPIINAWRTMKDVPARTTESDAMSRDLAARGFRFVGPTICYAFMQATGMVNDHLVTCFRHRACGGAPALDHLRKN
jgi:DNA-3-methyladenine glycosylase I